MSLQNEIERAVKYVNASLSIHSSVKRLNEQEIYDKTIIVSEDLATHRFDFTRHRSTVLTQGEKKRRVVHYEELSTESILCQYVKQMLDRQIKVKYPNRNKVIHTLFDCLKAVKDMSSFTIIKYDFNDYFNSVSTTYVFEKYLSQVITNRFEFDLLRNFCQQSEYAHIGLCTSNVISEIIAIDFDNQIRSLFASKGILFFERYIDDTILIVNQHISNKDCHDLLRQALDSVFHDKSICADKPCKTKFNKSKYRYISRKDLKQTPSFDFLGYEFTFSQKKNNVLIKYGITQEKREKYNKRLSKMIADYKSNHDLELLRHRISAFTSRTVYISSRFHQSTWNVKGFISNYGELRYLLETEFIEPDTKIFLESMVCDAFKTASISLPYFIRGSKNQQGYNLYENMLKNRTLLLVEQIGCDKGKMQNLCSQIGIKSKLSNGMEKSYRELVHQYLIKTFIGD